MRRGCFSLLVALLIAALVRPVFLDAQRLSGQFTTRYGATADPALATIRQEATAGRVLEEMASGLNEVLSLPKSIELALEECLEANALYDSEARRISLCYELIAHVGEVFAEEGEEDAEELADGAVAFFLFHELGHALIDVLDLPVTGREEDAVDQLATVILADGSDEGEGSALSGAVALAKLGDAEALNDLAFADEHSLSRQRFFNIVCWIYGHSPKSYDWVVREQVLPAERAQKCPAEYQRISSSWEKLLTPYVKQGRN